SCQESYLREIQTLKVGGPDRDRTGDLLNAIQARSQLRYRPTLGGMLETFILALGSRGSKGSVPVNRTSTQLCPKDRHAGSAVQTLGASPRWQAQQPAEMSGGDARAKATQPAGGPPPLGSGRRRASWRSACPG